MRSKEESQLAPTIIVKKVTHAPHGHHGGAWKVAYADFVTAMMAFFLLMWLLNAVPSDQLKGIAQYFEPTLGIAGQQGIGFAGGKVQTSEQGINSSDKAKGIKYGVTSAGEMISVPKKGTSIQNDELENEAFAMVEGELKKAINSDTQLKELQNSIDFEITPEGMMIRISEQDQHPMFKPGSPELTDFCKTALLKVSKLIKFSPNFLSVDGYTDKSTNSDNVAYSNWELSADRANAARRFLIESGIPGEQIARVVGRGDSSPLNKENPFAANNRRITVTLLRNSVMPYNKISAPQELTSAPARVEFEQKISVSDSARK